MNYTDCHGLTEDCPLTRNKSSKCTLADWCTGGFKFIVCCFTLLTLSITAILVFQLVYSDNITQSNIRFHGAVATDDINCSQIGTKILKCGGNAVDAAVAATLCMLVVAPHKTGLGGGGYIMIYSHKAHTIPLVINFANNTGKETFESKKVRLPAVLKGLELAHSLHGILPWSQIVVDSAKLAKDGFVVSKELSYETSKSVELEILYGHLSPGSILKLPKLANTLETVAKFGSSAFYNGTLLNDILRDDVVHEGLLRELVNYEPEVEVAKKSTFYGHTVYHPSHALSLQSTLEALEKLRAPLENASTVESEMLAARSIIQSNLMSLEIAKRIESERYASVVAMDWQDIYVSIITGLSAPLGLGHMTGAGFLLDKIEDDVELSTLMPVIFRHEGAFCGLRGIFGTDDAVVAGQLLYNLFVRSLNVSAAVEYPRYYLLSDGIAVQSSLKDSMEVALRSQLDTTLPLSHTDANSILKSINVITKFRDSMVSHSDSRGGGRASRF